MKRNLPIACGEVVKASQLPRNHHQQPGGGQITVGGYYIEALDRLKKMRRKSRVTPFPAYEETPNPDLIRKETPEVIPIPDGKVSTP